MPKCNACSGNGSRKCPKCEGKGRLSEGWMTTKPVQCNNCHGSGVVKCGVCHGKGWL